MDIESRAYQQQHKGANDIITQQSRPNTDAMGWLYKTTEGKNLHLFLNANGSEKLLHKHER